MTARARQYRGGNRPPKIAKRVVRPPRITVEVGGKKLTAAQVVEMRVAYAADPRVGAGTLGKRYGISQVMASSIIRGVWWRKAGGPISEIRRAYGVSAGGSKLDDDRVRAIRSAYAKGGATIYTLAASYGVSAQSISRILRGERWAHVV